MRKKNIRYFIFLALTVIFLLLAPDTIFITSHLVGGNAAHSSQTYFVATNGDDSDPGTFEQPWSSIQRASETMVAGDIVFIRGGSYYEQVSTIRDGNSSNGYIAFTAYPGETPIIDGTGVEAGNDGFTVSNSYVRITGLEIRNWDGHGFRVSDVHHIEISQCKILDVGYGIGIMGGAHDFVLNAIDISRFTSHGVGVFPSEGTDSYNGMIIDCVVHTSQDPEQYADGFFLSEGDLQGFVFRGCEAYGAYDGFDIGSRDTILEGCSAHDNTNSGYRIWDDNVTLVNSLSYNNAETNIVVDWSGVPKTTTLMNSHFVDSQTYNVLVASSSDTLEMYNCILAGGDYIGLAIESLDQDGYHGDNNIFHNDDPNRAIVVWGSEAEFSLSTISGGGWTDFGGQDQHSLVALDPGTDLFVNFDTWDLHLREGSVAIDAGTPENAPLIDHDWVPRPQGGGYDIGAYEYRSPERPDLIVTDIWDDSGMIYYQIRNLGHAQAQSGHDTALFVDDVNVMNDSVNADLAYGEKYRGSFDYNWYCTSLDVNISVRVDQGNDVAEINETNNQKVEKWRCDTTSPEIVTGPIIQDVDQDSAVVYWETDEESDSSVKYGDRAGVNENEISDSNQTLIHIIPLTGLEPSTTYNFVVESTDPSGNTIQSSNIYFETTHLHDEIAPVVSINVTDISGNDFTEAEAARAQVFIEAEAYDNYGVEKVEFYLNGELLFTDFSPPYDFSLNTRQYADGEYNVAVKAFDLAKGYASTNKSIQISNPVDETAPIENSD